MSDLPQVMRSTVRRPVCFALGHDTAELIDVGSALAGETFDLSYDLQPFAAAEVVVDD